MMDITAVDIVVIGGPAGKMDGATVIDGIDSIGTQLVLLLNLDVATELASDRT